MSMTVGRHHWPDEKLISRALSAKTNKAYWDNLRELRGRASVSLYERCLALTGSELPVERIVGVDILAQLYRKVASKNKRFGLVFPYRKKVLKLFLEMLVVENDKNAIHSILYGISHNNAAGVGAKAIDILIPFVQSEDKDICRALVAALSGIEHMKAVRGLIALSKDRHSETRNWATFGIGTLSDLDNDEIRNALLARCTDRHHDTRMEAIYGLAKRKDLRVKKYLEKASSEWTVYVLESIQALNATEYLPILESMLRETENDPETDTYWLGHLQDCIDTLWGGGRMPDSVSK